MCQKIYKGWYHTETRHRQTDGTETWWVVGCVPTLHYLNKNRAIADASSDCYVEDIPQRCSSRRHNDSRKHRGTLQFGWLMASPWVRCYGQGDRRRRRWRWSTWRNHTSLRAAAACGGVLLLLLLLQISGPGSCWRQKDWIGEQEGLRSGPSCHEEEEWPRPRGRGGGSGNI